MSGQLNVFFNSHLNIEGGYIRWDDHTCFISAISQLWIGKPIEKKWGMTKETEDESVNIELNSGSIYCFVSASHDFLVQIYELLCEIVVRGLSEKPHSIDFQNNLLETMEEPEEEVEEVEEIKKDVTPAIEFKYTGNLSYKQELLILIDHYKRKENQDPLVLPLLEEIAGFYDGKNNSNLHELYKNFINLFLISDCNELGLNMLIAEIKTRIYG